ncbi:hypothetical protein SGI36_19115 [Providencia rettgeri]|uniref:hypothetical protein n=1 Tax=Providencia TaxID=586 RepID=UPI001B3757EC|nr:MULTISPECIES: hypothetical protein [Providencia]MBQ0532583.1 hypothetical protein [Providencia rettgeri]WOB84979.1 hypothetical protein P3L40_15125 [Providencia sp. PROV040]HEM8181529.1 hypothetical protein [Providencia rettgeri]
MSVISSAISLLVGAFLGNRLSLRREKRKEYNEKFDIVFKQIHTEKELWSYIPLEPVRDRIKHNDMRMLIFLSSKNDKNKLNEAWMNYLAAIEYGDPFSDPHEYHNLNYSRVPLIKNSLDDLLNVMKRK